jgi:hypothetical protein
LLEAANRHYLEFLSAIEDPVPAGTSSTNSPSGPPDILAFLPEKRQSLNGWF